jgi:hypothetical protein
MDGNSISIGRSLCFDLHLVASQKDQETSLGTSVLKRGHHERVDQFIEDNLAGYGLGHFDDCC